MNQQLTGTLPMDQAQRGQSVFTQHLEEQALGRKSE
jgi:hypothetical protein